MKDKKKGFTLIELLVVISIIALLLGVLVLTLNMARGRANIAVCSSNLGQIMKAFELYMMDYDYNTMFSIRNNDADKALYWMGKLAKYVGDPTYGDKFEKNEVIKTLICPSAPAEMVKRCVVLWPIADNPGLGGKAKAPALYRQRLPDGEWRETLLGYGINGWIGYDYFHNPRQDPTGRKFYKKYIDAPYNTPIFADSVWIWGCPKDTDTAPTIEGLTSPWENGAVNNHMWRFCVDRHRMKIDMVFKDTHVETVPLNKLWSFPWHVNFKKQNKVIVPGNF